MTKDSKEITDNDRLEALEAAFTQQKIQAMAKNKHRGIATVRKICEIAKVDHTYLYDEKKSPNYILYNKFRNKVLEFEREFKLIKSGVEDVEADIKQKYLNSLESNLKLSTEKNDLRQKLQNKNNLIQKLQSENTSLQIVNTNTHAPESSNKMNQNTVNYISPDHGLQRNEQYEFYDVKLREKAWSDAKTEFIQLIRRDLPIRVYILIGLPCSGKTEWSKNLKNLMTDRHSIVVDATNLKVGDRAIWLNLANQGKNVKKCAVRFVTDFMTIRKRNEDEQRLSSGKRLALSILESKRNEFEEVNIVFEDFDEMIVIREE